MPSLNQWLQVPSLKNKHSDLDLFDRAIAGDRVCAAQLIDKLTPQAYVLAWRMTGNPQDAEDMLQESFIKLFSAQNFKGQSSLKTYFYSIVAHTCMDQLRIKKNDTVSIDEDDFEKITDGNSPPLHLFEKQKKRDIQGAMLKLNPRQRMAIALWVYQDAGVPEIAKVLRIESNAAHQLLYRAKENLKLLLGGLKNE